MLINRIDELQRIEEAIKRHRSVIVLGMKGIGKSAVLEEVRKKHKCVYCEYGSLKQILQTLVKHYGLNEGFNPKYSTIQEMLEAVKPLVSRYKPIILIDEMDYMGKPSCRTLEKLMLLGATIIGAAEKKPRFEFREIIELNPLDREHSKTLALELLKEHSNDELLNLIATKSEGLPYKIVEICHDYKIGVRCLDVMPWKKKSIHDFIAGIKPKIVSRVNILPLWLLFVIGFGLLLLRYYFYQWGDFQEGYLVAMFGYTSLILYRLLTVKKE